jgi:pyruvate dehydrogenase (quinone)
MIDVVTDPLELVMPPKVTLDQAKGFSIWMMKAVLNGQGNELVQLALSAWRR